MLFDIHTSDGDLRNGFRTHLVLSDHIDVYSSFSALFQELNSIYNAAFTPTGREFQKISSGVGNRFAIEDSVFPNEKYKFNGRNFRVAVNSVSSTYYYMISLMSPL